MQTYMAGGERSNSCCGIDLADVPIVMDAIAQGAITFAGVFTLTYAHWRHVSPRMHSLLPRPLRGMSSPVLLAQVMPDIENVKGAERDQDVLDAVLRSEAMSRIPRSTLNLLRALDVVEGLAAANVLALLAEIAKIARTAMREFCVQHVGKMAASQRVPPFGDQVSNVRHRPQAACRLTAELHPFVGGVSAGATSTAGVARQVIAGAVRPVRRTYAP